MFPSHDPLAQAIEKYLNALDELIEQGTTLNKELDNCIETQEQIIKELKQTNKLLDKLI